MATMQQITPSLYQISLGPVNVFVIKDQGLTLIDTGNKGSMEPIFAALRKGGENPNAIKQIILTHAHPDHAGSAADIKNKLSVPLLAYQDEVRLIEEGMAGRTPMFLSPGVINWIVYNLFIKRATKTNDPIGVDQSLTHNEILPVAGGLQVLHTPGHSAGHIALLLKKEGILIAGDICTNVAGLDVSTVNEDKALSIRSIIDVSELSFDKAVFGHGSLLKDGANQKLKAKFSPLNSPTND
jgi:glyoxylase-like metal-dependent hydrolase (beta-lactamase superfamily II)